MASTFNVIFFLGILLLRICISAEAFQRQLLPNYINGNFKRPQELLTASTRWDTSSPTGVTRQFLSSNGEIFPEWRNAAELSSLSKLTTKTVLDFDGIKKVLPHRYPFLLIDKIILFEPGRKVVGVKQISGNEDPFNGHFPDRAVMPGVLQIEALAQLCGIVCLQDPVSDGVGDFFFASVDGVKWKKPVVPGDTLILEAELLAWRPNFGIAKMTGRGYVDGELVLTVKELTFALVREDAAKSKPT